MNYTKFIKISAIVAITLTLTGCTTTAAFFKGMGQGMQRSQAQSQPMHCRADGFGGLVCQ